MADFPLPVGRGANANHFHRLRAGSIPNFAFTPLMSWSVRQTFGDLARTTSTQSIAITITDDTDGDHVLTFSGGGLAEPVALDAFAASTDTVEDIATGLEAIVEAARAADEPLDGIVTAESVTDATISITALPKAPGTPPLVVTHTVDDVDGVPTLVYSYTITFDHTSTASEIHGTEAYTHLFPEMVVRDSCTLNRRVAFSGATSMTIVVGDADAANGLLTVTSLGSAGCVDTVGAAENTPRFEAAFVPQWVVGLASATPLHFGSLTAGEFEIEIAYCPTVAVP